MLYQFNDKQKKDILYSPTRYKGKLRYNGHLPTAATIFP